MTTHSARTGPDRPHLQRVLADITADGFLGVTLRVRDRDGEWTGGAGVRGLDDASAPSPDVHFRIGSNTKTFVAATTLGLVVDGALTLDEPVVDHLPGFALDPRITVRMLLQHTSGVFNFTGEYYPDGTVVPGIAWQGGEWVENRMRTYPPRELIELALGRPPRFEPGTEWSYSNTNYVLLRLLIEQVSGRSAAEQIARKIVDPLGLSGTVVPTTQTELPAPQLPAYYRYDDASGRTHTVDVTEQNPSWISSGGDMISTTRDLQIFISALTAGELLPADVLAQMLTPHPTPVPDMGYGLGVFVQDLGEGRQLVTHNGGIAGHAGLMYASADGSTTLTAAMNGVYDAQMSLGAAYQQATARLVDEVFGAVHRSS